METTRQTVLGILRRRRHCTVEELRQELDLAPATVRRHLDILVRDGHVDVTQVRRATGRPHYVFSLSQAGEDLFPKHYARVTNRMIEEIVALSPSETQGRGGKELADLVFQRMTQRLAQRIAPRVRGALGERVRTTVEALAEEGILFDVERDGGSYVLVGHGCPCPRVAGAGGQVCAHDQSLLAILLRAGVTAIDPSALGQEAYCAYRVQERESNSRPELATPLPAEPSGV